MYELIAIVKNKEGRTIGYNIKNISTGKIYECINIEQLRSLRFTNAKYIQTSKRKEFLKGNPGANIPQIVVTEQIITTPVIKDRSTIYTYGKSDVMSKLGIGQHASYKEDIAKLKSYDNSNCARYFIYETEIKEEELDTLDLRDYGTIAAVAVALRNILVEGTKPNTVYRELQSEIERFVGLYSPHKKKVDIVRGWDLVGLDEIIKGFILDELSIEHLDILLKQAKVKEQACLISGNAIRSGNVIRVIHSDRDAKVAKAYSEYRYNIRKAIFNANKIRESTRKNGKQEGHLYFTDFIEKQYRYICGKYMA